MAERTLSGAALDAVQALALPPQIAPLHTRPIDVHIVAGRRHEHSTKCECVSALVCVQGMTPQQFLDTMAVDKKVLDGQLRLVLLKGPLGNCVITADFPVAKLQETLQAFCH